MNRLEFSGVLALALLAGINITGAVHELGHLAVASAFGAHVVQSQPWQFLANARTVVSPLPSGQHAVVAVSGVRVGTGFLVLALLLVRWPRLKPWVPVAGALGLASAFYQLRPFFMCPLRSDSNNATLFALATGCNELALSLITWCVLGVILWFRVQRTRFIRNWRQAWAEASRPR